MGDPLDQVGRGRGPPPRRPPLLLGRRGGGLQEELKGESYFPEFNDRKRYFIVNICASISLPDIFSIQGLYFRVRKSFEVFKKIGG